MSSHCPPENDQHEKEQYPSDCQILEAYRARAREKEASHDDPGMRLLLAKAEPVRLLLLDVDGVLTDGSLIYTETGTEGKCFNTQDGFGIRLVQKAGVEVGVITARTSQIVARRAAELGMKYVFQGAGKKLACYQEIIATAGLKPFQVCYMGDDWLDLCLLGRAGLAACPANAVPEVQERCHFVSRRTGGSGAVRELCDLIILAKGARETLLQQFIS